MKIEEINFQINLENIEKWYWKNDKEIFNWKIRNGNENFDYENFAHLEDQSRTFIDSLNMWNIAENIYIISDIMKKEVWRDSPHINFFF